MCSAVLAVEIVAHRGASDDAPENTLAAFRLAWQQQTDAVEGDFYLTRDGRIVCIHDATTDRTTRLKAKVAELTLAELVALDAGSWKAANWRGERVPTIEEVLATVPAGKKVFLEIKCGPQVLEPLKRAVESAGLRPEQAVIISFQDEVIQAAKQAMPQSKAFWLHAFENKDGRWTATQDEVLARLQRTGADGLDVGLTKESAEMVNERLASGLREAKLELHVWTVDDVELAKYAIKLGARSITTNRPGWLRQQLSK